MHIDATALKISGMVDQAHSAQVSNLIANLTQYKDLGFTTAHAGTVSTGTALANRAPADAALTAQSKSK